ncbi:putative aflatoxin biosynthesis ketoreductase nor-1 [Diaporthe ampelina]|uniref:Putative aflatoxin biosynthesis ketoreductase nor-1 n=1 Tax=Diaporthe ampelina TaxID=1214573 RepID=A0A0G2FMG0_9PEZI|nr:putative aflatoxin biosynthesis ketoreductase nor-1 [Diaporthe ampelina]
MSTMHAWLTGEYTPTILLISGANRGLGKGLVERYLARDGHTVIAAVRDPNHPTSRDLADLPKGQHSRLVVVKIDSTAEADASKAVEELSAQGIGRLDLVIANAAYAPSKAAVH